MDRNHHHECGKYDLKVQRTTVTDVFDPTAIWDESVFCNHVFKLIHLKLSKSPFLGDVHLLVTRELGLAEGLNHVLLVLQFGANGCYDLANVDPGHCALGLSKRILKPKNASAIEEVNSGAAGSAAMYVAIVHDGGTVWRRSMLCSHNEPYVSKHSSIFLFSLFFYEEELDK
ncbi:hypothetical protein MG293_007792 [Ovis ammon polii]|uniref:Uncharacterized protein n=1 Tax=Ovis ammon polii TaxID=230172 RepID=A0AAD4YC42_OVIAM|nr:hypothetical protein MG293_007792 [Ovis ammon polii]